MPLKQDMSKRCVSLLLCHKFANDDTNLYSVGIVVFVDEFW